MSDYRSKIIFLGTPDFALPTLKALIENDLKPVLVITQPDKPVSRKQELTPPPIKELALANNLPVAQPNNKEELLEIFNQYQVDVCVLVAYGMIITEEVLLKPKFGFLNLHPSLLPKYRGPSPIQATLLNGDSETGMSIIELTNKVDAGSIVAQKKLKIESSDNAETLHDKLAQLGAELLVEVLPDYLAGNVKANPQDDMQATYTKKIDREDGEIDWQKKAIEIKRQFQAFYPWPGIFTHLAKKRLKIINLSLLEGDFPALQQGKDPDLALGEVFLGPDSELAVKCSDGAISLTSIQLEGKKEMSGQEFLRGQKDLIGKILK